MEVIDDIPYIRSGDVNCHPQKAKRTIRVPAAPAPHSSSAAAGYHDLPDPTSLESDGEAPPADAAPPGDEESDEDPLGVESGAVPEVGGNGSNPVAAPDCDGAIPPPPLRVLSTTLRSVLSAGT